MKTFIAAAVALVAGIAIGVPAFALADSGTPETYGGYQVVTVTAATDIVNGSAIADAYCPDETWALTGGGFFVNNFNARVIDNRNVDPAEGASYWHVTATVGNSPSTGSVTAQAICTKLG